MIWLDPTPDLASIDSTQANCVDAEHQAMDLAVGCVSPFSSLRLLSTRLPGVSQAWVEPARSLLEAPSPAVLTTYRKDGSAHTVPVWYRWTGEAFEVVIAKGDVKLRHLARDPRCVLVVFEAVRPFRGMEVCGGWPSWSRATSRRRGLQSLAAISAWVTASASPPTGGPGQGCSSGSSPTAHGYGTCRESCHPDRPDSIDRPAVRVACGWVNWELLALAFDSCRKVPNRPSDHGGGRWASRWPPRPSDRDRKVVG